MKERDLDLQGAVDYIGQRTKEAIDEYVALKASLPSWGPGIDEQVETYLLSLEYITIGYMQWSFNSGRYFGEEVEEVKRTLWVTLSPQLST